MYVYKIQQNSEKEKYILFQFEKPKIPIFKIESCIVFRFKGKK